MTKAVISKTQFMQAVIAGTAHESFEHSELGVFDISACRARAPLDGALITSPIDDTLVDLIRCTRVVDDDRIMELSEHSWRSDPALLFYLFEDGEKQHILVDGTHRILRRWHEGLRTFDAWEIPLHMAIRFDSGWRKRQDADWGDEVIDGKIVKRSC